MKQEIQKFGEYLHKSKKILLINHIRMDGDAWGALGGLAIVLENIGKEVVGVNDEAVPESLSFTGHTNIINPELDIAEYAPDLIISLDASDTGRLGNIYIDNKEIFDATPFVVIDHHSSNPGFGDINIIDTCASSTCEIVYITLQELGIQMRISPDAATLLYTGLQTDTNLYFNSNTSPTTLRIGADLIELGADFQLPIYECFQKKTPEQMKLYEIGLRNIKFTYNGKCVSSRISIKELIDLGIEFSQIGSYLKLFINDVLKNMQGAEIMYLIYPLSLEENKVSMRCKEPHNVAAICESYQGGGHILAAGFQRKEAVKVIEEELEEIIASQLL